MRSGYVIVYFRTPSGARPAREFLDGLSPKARDKCFSYIDLLREWGTSLRASHLRKIENDLWELQPEFGGTEYRLFFGVYGDTFVFTHGIVKKRQRTARSDIDLAQRRFAEWKEMQQ